MARVIGIDPGTLSFDLCGLDNGQSFLETTISSPELATNPALLIEALQSAGPLDLVIGPSGYGLPWVPIADFSDEDLFLLALADERDQDQAAGIGGLPRMIAALQASGLPVMFMPAVIHLPTVPAYRKANKIDMGTADKLCCAALGVVDQARHFDLAYHQTSFIYVEVGGAFTAVLAVANGQVVDGLGGSAGPPGFYALGALDGELAYLLGKFSKNVLFSGGVAYIAGQPELPLAQAAALAEVNWNVRQAWEAFFEGVVKSVAAELTIAPQAREILLSGRLCRFPELLAELTGRLGRLAPVRQITGLSSPVKEAAQGAAIIADGIMGGQFADLVGVMRLGEATGTVLDYLHVRGAAELKRAYRKT